VDLVDDQCRKECGKAPQEESECKGHLNDHYSCKTRLISDNASFHLQRGWKSLLKADTLQLLSLIQSSHG
jgi:hypothetical protein